MYAQKSTYWVPQKLPQMYTVILYICVGKIALFTLYIFVVILDKYYKYYYESLRLKWSGSFF